MAHQSRLHVPAKTTQISYLSTQIFAPFTSHNILNEKLRSKYNVPKNQVNKISRSQIPNKESIETHQQTRSTKTAYYRPIGGSWDSRQEDRPGEKPTSDRIAEGVKRGSDGSQRAGK